MASDAVEKIKERLSILDVVAPYVELHKAGKSYKGKSPFTNEKTPSFHVSPDRGMYYCFSTSQGGDIFTFIQIMEGVDFKGALAILAEKAGVELVPEDPKKRSARDQQYALLDEATTFFTTMLHRTDDAMSYLTNRGVTRKTIEQWRIGYAPGPPAHGWRELRDHLTKQKHSDAEMLAAGLIKQPEGGKAPYDVFRDRVMFPIMDTSGRVVGFSGRILTKDSDAPKYVNSPETELFNKSEVLFGYDKAKQGIRQYDFSLIVEGQFDVVLSHQAGYSNTVAVSGTALTAHHVALLQRLSNRVVLALDADRAGIAAVQRAADLMLTRGMDVKVARLPEGEDPADLIREGTKRFRDTIGHAMHVIEFLLAVTKEGSRDERTYKLRVRDEVVPYLLRIESQIDREHFTGVIAEALSTTADAIRLEVSRLERERATEPAPEEAATASAQAPTASVEPTATRRIKLAYYFVALDALLEDHERTPLQQAFERSYGESLDAVRSTTPAEVVSPLTFRLESELGEVKRRQLYAELAHSLEELRQLTLKERLKERRSALTEAERAGDEQAAEKLLNELSLLQRSLAEPAISDAIFPSPS